MDFADAQRHIANYNTHGLHYNLVADGVYAAHRRIGDPFSPAYLPYLIAALISFDMGRQLDMGPDKKYGSDDGSFAPRLGKRLKEIAQFLEPLAHGSLVDIVLEDHAEAISTAYTLLARGGEQSLSAKGNAFDVGATKILHFLNPDLFVIIDRNVAQSLARARRTDGRPVLTGKRGYSGQRYVQSLEAVQEWIVNYGSERFQALEPDTPLLRIFDKIAFASGGNANSSPSPTTDSTQSEC
jgi:hypothetical protein